MRTSCKSCGAPLNSKKCDYCGIIHNDWTQDSQQSTDNLNYDAPYDNNFSQNNMTDIDVPQTAKHNKLGINTASGIFAIVNAVVLFFYTRFLWSEIALASANYIMIGFIFFMIIILMIAALIIHIIALVQSKKKGISVAGHILGIIAAVITLLTLTLFSFVSIILFILAAIFNLRQKNVRPQSVNSHS